MGAGDQPDPAPTLAESSSAERKAWLRKGSPHANASHCTAGTSETPRASRARTSLSRSAIGFPNERIGLNLGLRALLRSPDRPAVHRNTLARTLDPRPSEHGAFD